MGFSLSYSPEQLILQAKPEQVGLIGRIFGKQRTANLDAMISSDRDLLLALADLRALADENAQQLDIAYDHIQMSHRLAASLDSNTAEILGLPQTVDLTLKTDAEGVVGAEGFRLRYEWSRNGVQQFPTRVGSILETASGTRRIPLWMMEALDIADGFRASGDDAADWAALARFRQALDPGTNAHERTSAARLSLTDFLSKLEVRIADSFSISPTAGGDDFEVVAFDSHKLDGFAEARVGEAAGELIGDSLRTFQRRVRERGALNAYRLAPGSYMVVDPKARPALDVMTSMQKAPVAERVHFMSNPRARITAAVEASLRAKGGLEGLRADAEEQAVEAAATPVFVETREFSERVTGVRVFAKLLDLAQAGGTTWLPETFAKELAQKLGEMSRPELEALRSDVQNAMAADKPTVDVEGLALPAVPAAIEVIDAHIEKSDPPFSEDVAPQGQAGPLVLDTVNNFDELRWEAKLRSRTASHPPVLPAHVVTPLKQHQKASFDWQISAWKSGLPGILNADEPGLGKTLQTIAFLTWLQSRDGRRDETRTGPVLIVAPTSLLENWEQEVFLHTTEPRLGHLVRLYGSATAVRKLPDATGKDIDTGETKLDFGFLHEAIEEGRAHRFWLLTTYTTLTNYQHSLGQIPFAAVVFDEIQALKNPDSLRAHAARSLNADFRIGLTGTPIENSVVDLWSIMDQLAPGCLDSLKAFRERYGEPDETSMAELHARVFNPTDKRPALALRRTKDAVANDLPPKKRLLHPRAMPEAQARVYEDARLKLAQGGRGGALKMLHHIRTVSVHPNLGDRRSNADFIAGSARLGAAFSVLREIAGRRECALVFIEHRQMQYRFIELARAEFGLKRIDLINGDTPIPQRQAIVNRFQENLGKEEFDVLVLGPKAAGTGLTLTAATHVVHLSRWWNPAVEEQCNDRIHRIGQRKPVTIHIPMSVHTGYREHSFDCLLHSLMQRKRKLASSALWPMGDTESDVGELQKMLASDTVERGGDAVAASISAMFARDGQSAPVVQSDGSVPFL
jgi:superfamily II DNA or RNA helicase